MEIMYNELDFYFPYIVLFYGSIMTLMTNIPLLKQKLARYLDQEVLQWFYSHQTMGVVCLFVGSLWSFQRFLS